MRSERTSHRDTVDAKVLNWMLEDDQPSVRYHTLVDLLGGKAHDPEVKAAYSKIPRVG
jgi:hypothetical protein